MEFMNKNDIEKAVEFVKKKYQGCPHCGALSVDIHDAVGLPLLKREPPSGFTVENKYTVAIPMVCDNCGYITFFAAKGIIRLE
jgi:predicted nucleic-acid-binding Zn-ribbon protein